MKALRLLVARLAAFRFLHLAIPFITYVHPLCSLGFQDVSTSGLGFPSSVTLLRLAKAWKQRDLPSSWATLFRICPALRPRRDFCVRPYDAQVLSPHSPTTRTPAFRYVSWLNDTASAIAVYASRPWSPTVMQDSLLTAGQALSDWIWIPTGLLRKVSSTRILLSQALLGAMVNLT